MVVGALASIPLPSAAAPGDALLVNIDGPIGPAVSGHVVKALQNAAATGAPFVVLRIDTPGGLDASMRDIVKAILNSPVPVIGFVGPSGARAASAGTYILYATHVAAMAPATNLGAATPIPIGGAPKPPTMPKGPEESAPGKDEGEKTEAPPETSPQDAAGKKAVNDAIAYIRSLAEKRGRNADWAEEAVRDGASVSAEKALELGVIDLVAESVPALLRELDGRKVQVGEREVELATADAVLEEVLPDWRTQLLAVITNPTVAYLLLMIGIYGLILEGYNPGAFVPGVVGAICLLLALFAFQVLPVNYTGLLLIILGLVLMITEAFVPSFGILGFGGIAAFVFGSIMLMDTEVPGYQVPLAMVGSIALAGALLVGVTVYLLMKSRKAPVVSGAEAIVGTFAEAIEDFTGEGTVHLLGENWQARCEQPVRRGQRVVVTAREGLLLTVKPADAGMNQGSET